MRTWKQSAFFGMVALITITLVLTACGDGGNNDNDDDNNVVLPASVGTNEFLGETLYLDRWSKIVFDASETTFKYYMIDRYYYGDDYELDNEGSYSYNSENKTITLAIEYVYWFGSKMNRTQAVNFYLKSFDDMIAKIKADLNTYLIEENLGYLLPEEFWDDYYDYDGSKDWDEFAVDWMEENNFDINAAVSEYKTQNGLTDADSYINRLLDFNDYSNLNDYRGGCKTGIEKELALATYDYQFLNDGESLLVQKKLPANKGTDELKGKDFTCEWRSLISYYTFSASDNTYTATDDWFYTPPKIVETGTYAYDSVAKDVYLRPEKVYNDYENKMLTMLEYYSRYDDAPYVNEGFTTNKLRYRLNPNSIASVIYTRW
jgi:hypothetical protein